MLLVKSYEDRLRKQPFGDKCFVCLGVKSWSGTRTRLF